MSRITRTRDALTGAQELAIGHADAAHSGTFDSDCPACIGHAAACGVDLQRRSSGVLRSQPPHVFRPDGYGTCETCGATCAPVEVIDNRPVCAVCATA